VFPPFVLPECLILALGVFPVRLHIRQSWRGTGGLKDPGNIGVRSGIITIGIKSSIAWETLVFAIQEEDSQYNGPACIVLVMSVDKRGTYQSPWMVHELLGPVAGFVSQNCVCKRSPPGELKQQVS
jgi:hypothetical protein